MSANRKQRGGVPFRIVEGGRDLHRQPIVPLPARPSPGAITARALLTALLAGLAVVGALHLFARIWP